MLNVPLSNHAFEDMILLSDALKQHLPFNSINIQLESMKKMFEVMQKHRVSC